MDSVKRKLDRDWKQALKGALQTAVKRTDSIISRFSADSRINTVTQAGADGLPIGRS